MAVLANAPTKILDIEHNHIKSSQVWVYRYLPHVRARILSFDGSVKVSCAFLIPNLDRAVFIEVNNNLNSLIYCCH